MIIRGLVCCLAVACGWIAVLAGAMVLTDAAPAALVMFPDPALLAALPDGVAITGKTAISVTLTSDGMGLTHLLYDAGALLVLPAGLLGCAPSVS